MDRAFTDDKEARCVKHAEAGFKVRDTQLFINGEFVDSLSGKTFPVVNPTTEDEICEVQEALKDDVDRAVDAAVEAFESTWRHVDGPGRRDLMLRLAVLIEENKDDLANLETLNNGKPRWQANGNSRSWKV